MSASLQITLPDIGDYKDVPVIELLVKSGDRIEVDQPLFSIESDKATMEVPSPVAGVIQEMLVGLGTSVSQGTPIMMVAVSDEDGALLKTAKPEAINRDPPTSEPLEPIATALAHDQQETRSAIEGRIERPSFHIVESSHATPSVRAYARELRIDLSNVDPTGPNRRILREDLQKFVKAAIAATDGGSAAPRIGTQAESQIDFAKYGEIERQTLSRIQQISSARLTRNWQTIPHVTNFDNADVTELEIFRKELNGERQTKDIKLTMVAFLIKASAFALKVFPRFNASLDGNELILKKYVHIGFAVDTPKGLMVPIIRDCDRKGLVEIAREMQELAEKARAGQLSPPDMQGGCFSISSLGGIGGAGFTPIINAPEVAILGAARSKMEGIWDGGKFVPRLIMPVSLSWDHRVVDGVAAARFLGHITMMLTDFRRAVL
jgi:pyruvate dehydrogenase E2 component (dihydrolipoamide acetyltransferase)